MGEIIKFPGNSSEKSEQPDEVLDKGKITLLLEALNSYYKTQPTLQNNIALRIELLSDSSDEFLIKLVNTSSENDWRKRPAYYGAIVDILSSRELL